MGEHIRLGRVATATRSTRRWWVAKVELVFDPLDLTRIEVRLAGAPMGLTASHRIGRHSHPKAKPEPPRRRRNPAGSITPSRSRPTMSWSPSRTKS